MLPAGTHIVAMDAARNTETITAALVAPSDGDLMRSAVWQASRGVANPAGGLQSTVHAILGANASHTGPGTAGLITIEDGLTCTWGAGTPVVHQHEPQLEAKVR